MKSILLTLTLAFGLSLTSIAAAEEMEQTSVTAQNTRAYAPSYQSNDYDRRLRFHQNRGRTGKGYTRFYGRRSATAERTIDSTRILREEAKASVESSLDRNRLKTPRKVAVPIQTTQGYSPVRYYHSNRFRKNYSRYHQYSHFKREQLTD